MSAVRLDSKYSFAGDSILVFVFFFFFLTDPTPFSRSVVGLGMEVTTLSGKLDPILNPNDEPQTRGLKRQKFILSQS